MLKFFNRQGVQVMGADDIGLLKGLGTVVVFDKNGIIYRLRTLLNWTLNKRDIFEFWGCWIICLI